MGSTTSKENTTPQTVTTVQPNINTQPPETNVERVQQVQQIDTTENKPSFLYNLKNIFTGKNNNQPVSTGGKKKTLRKKLKSKKNKKTEKNKKHK